MEQQNAISIKWLIKEELWKPVNNLPAQEGGRGGHVRGMKSPY